MDDERHAGTIVDWPEDPYGFLDRGEDVLEEMGVEPETFVQNMALEMDKVAHQKMTREEVEQLVREAEANGFADDVEEKYEQWEMEGDEENEENESEDIVPIDEESEPVMRANLDAVVEKPRLATTLGTGLGALSTVEHLLSALEACGVDNARIEFEGGPEVPLLDGSAKFWVKAIEEAGMQVAKTSQGKMVRRLTLQPDQYLCLKEGDAFIALYPDTTTRITCGVDFTAKAPVIGNQWHSWAPAQGLSYLEEVGLARTFCCKEDIQPMLDAGLIRGGMEGTALVADGDRWYNEHEVRYPTSEAARHKILDLIGDLSLLAEGGHAGLPHGHIVAFKTGHDMHIRFARMLREYCLSQSATGELEMVPADYKRKD